MAFVAIDGPPDCVSFSALFLALQFSVVCFAFLQKVHLFSSTGALVQNLVLWSLPRYFLHITLLQHLMVV